MSNGTEGRIVLTVGKEITRVNIIDGGKAVEILFNVSESDEKKSEALEPNVSSWGFEEMFPIVDIEGVSLEDSFMQYKPENHLAERVKKSIIEAKRSGMKNFRIPAIDPSLDDDGETIIYCEGRKPAKGKSANWWYENARKFMPSKNSRLRNELEHDVVLGVMLIKYLVEEEGYKVAEAWEAVCDDSTQLGHYENSKDAKIGMFEYEKTGSRQIGKCFDLANTFKIVKKRDDGGFISFGGDRNFPGWTYPLAKASSHSYSFSDVPTNDVGMLMLDV